MKRKKAKTTVKGITDAGWNAGGGVTSAFSVASLRAIDNTLSPSDAFRLSIDLRAALHARNEPLSHGKIRLFYRKSGDEILSGPLFDMLQNPCPGMSQSGFIYELGTWWDLAGETAVGTIFDGSGLPAGIYPLNPFRLRSADPVNPRHLSDVRSWWYYWDDGVQVTYDAASVVLLKNFNPVSSVRGSSPILSGVNEISAGYESMAYNRRFFSNNAEPSHIVNLPNISDPKEIDAFKEEYIANYSIRTGNSHKVMVVGGTDVSIAPVSTATKEGSYIALQQLTTDKIMRLYKVPPIHSGVYDKTIALSMGEQNKVFAETVTMPSAERHSQFFQMIADRFFKTGNPLGEKKRLSKSMRDSFEKAVAQRPNSDVIVLLDIDHLPIISELKSQKLEYAKAFQTTFKVSPLEAAEQVGIELEPNEANQQVWVTSTEQPYVAPSAQEPAVEVEPVELPDESEIPQEDDDLLAEKRQQARQISRIYRKVVLDKLDEGRAFRLNEADVCNTLGDDTLKQQFRLDFLAVKRLAAAGGDAKAAVKEYLNKTYNRRFFRGIK